MSRMIIGLMLLSITAGCNHCQRWRSCRQTCDNQCCQEHPACAPAAAPAAPAAPAAAATPQYMVPQASYMAASPGFAAPPQEMTGALGMGVMRICIPVPKMYAVPKPQPPQMVAIQQAPMMAPQMYMSPQAMVPQAAPSCPSTDAANSALLMALLQAQQQQNAPAAAPSAEEADLEARAQKLEQKIDALTEALEKGQ